MFDGILLRSTRCGPCFRFDSIDTSQFAGNASVPLIEAPFMPEVFRVLEDLENLHDCETKLDADLSLRGA